MSELDLSVVIPVYNEEALLETAVHGLLAKLHKTDWSFELILAENGSRDETAEIAKRLSQEHAPVQCLSCPEPNYGRALREGIERAQGRWVVCDEIDLGDLHFYHKAIAALEQGADMVVGSKGHPMSIDARPWIRRRGTQVINLLLRATLGFRGTDTHGLKAFCRASVLPVLRQCTVEFNLFASELVIRCDRAGLDVREVPLHVREIRPPSVGLLRRVPRVLDNLLRLVIAIRLGWQRWAKRGGSDMSVRALVLSIDLDSPTEYAAIHGVRLEEQDPHLMYRGPLRRFTKLCRDLGGRGTVFAVSRDVCGPAAEKLARLSEEGFDIGSHSHQHDYRLSRRQAGRIAMDLKRSMMTFKKECGFHAHRISRPRISFECRADGRN